LAHGIVIIVEVLQLKKFELQRLNTPIKKVRALYSRLWIMLKQRAVCFKFRSSNIGTQKHTA